MQATYPPISGFQVIEDKNLSPIVEFVQFRFPKSKKKRIREKWVKRKENFKRKETERFLKFEDKIIVSSKAYEILKNFNNKQNEKD
jgi:hypothetical protein